MRIKFWKMHGAGNDFIVIPDIQKHFPATNNSYIQRLCHRRDGIGSEGLLLLRPTTRRNAIKMLFFNPDGTAAAMCGNGARCAARLTADLNLTSSTSHLTLITGAGAVRARLLAGGNVRITLPPPTEQRLHQSMTARGQRIAYHYINTGVPHVVLLTKHLARLKPERLGAAIRHHRKFAPQGTNVNFMQLDRMGTLHVRTYERGVEAETLACGTGITACAVIAGYLNLTAPPVQVICAHGDQMVVDYRLNKSRQAAAVSLTGPTSYAFEGYVHL